MARKAVRKSSGVTAVTPDDGTEEKRRAAARRATSGGPLGVAKELTLSAMKDELSAAQADVEKRLQSGTLVLEIAPSQIYDAVGTDRDSPLGSGDGFLALRNDIEARGQKAPIRVRPEQSDWRPDAAGRCRPSDRFVLQSGRRRLAVCNDLGIKVLAIVTTVTPDAGLREDLIERFSENVLREDLSGFERYRSIGEIAEAFSEKSKTEIAEMIGHNRADVSIGHSVFTLADELIAYTDGAVRELPMGKIRPLVTKVKTWVDDGRPKVAQPSDQVAPSYKPKVYQAKGAAATVTARPGAKKVVLEFDVGADEKDIRESLEMFLKDHFG